MQLARRLYQLAHTAASGTLRLERSDGATASVPLELDHGWVHAVELSAAYPYIGAAPRGGDERLKRFLGLDAAGYDKLAFLANEKPRKWGAVSPFHPAQVLRNHADRAQPDLILWRVRAGAGRLWIATPPHASSLGSDERGLVSFLLQPRSLPELDAVGSAGLFTAERAARLLATLDLLGALAYRRDPSPSDWAVLELPEGASLDAIKQAFRRLARELHPDLHPQASPEDRRALEGRFAEVSAAYRRLV